MLISVITPTYNRAYILNQCYESLKSQTSKNFEWIVVDDGSTDNTKELVSSFIAEKIIDIKYIKQENGGKHRAHNTAVKASSGELCVCLDSDDALCENAIERAISIWEENTNAAAIGILALRGDFNEHKPICSPLPQGIKYSTMSELRDKYAFDGDTVLFFKTQVLKRHFFKEFTGEKFLTENNLYVDLDREGPMILSSEVLYYCEYLPDGLTSNYRKILYENPKGTADTYYKMMLNAKDIKHTLKCAVIAQAYKSLVEDTSELDFSKKRIILLIAKLGVPFFKKKYLYKGGTAQ